MSRILLPALALPLLLGSSLAAAQADSGPYGHRRSWDRGPAPVETQHAEPARRVSVEAWRAADAGSALRQGRIVIGLLAPGADDQREPDPAAPVYEAAVVDQLAARGYDTATAADPGQIAQVAVSRRVVVPEEAPHKPVSGAMSTTVSNRGSGFGLALAVDLTKPRKAIVATRLDVRIRDKVSGRVLWEGHAEGEAREGSDGAGNGAMATRLASALFARFPEGTVVAALSDSPGSE